jgi:ribosomal protein S18 acetylase RimI-like enzyme
MSVPIRLKKEQLHLASLVCSNAFFNDEQIKYFLPDPIRRSKDLPLFYEFLLRLGERYGQIFATSSQLEGLAVWMGSKQAPLSLWRLMRAGGINFALRAGFTLLLKVQYFTALVFDLHKRCISEPHWYLFLMAVDPKFQKQGHARNLLNTMLTDIDAENLPCYLETHNQKNVDLYQRYGFRIIEKITIPHTRLAFWGMVRNRKSERSS